jgi:hypothetical protein
VVDAVDYWLMQARLGLLDAVCGPEPKTVADKKREAERRRRRKAFPLVLIGQILEPPHEIIA